MVESGLVEEVRTFSQKYSPATAYQAIGYKELLPYFRGETSLEDAVDKIKQETRHYAKRQLTWFRRNERIRWIIIEDFGQKYEIFKNAEKTIANRRIM